MASELESQVLTQKVWVLRVSIHCEGCKKKIRRILSKVHGVSDVAIDAQRKMVTVTGGVDGDTLVKRLAKSNKYAVLLAPEGTPEPAKSSADAAPDQPKNEAQDTSKPKEVQEATREDKPAAAAPATAADEAAKNVDASSAPAAAPAAAEEPAQTNAETEKKDDNNPETGDKKTADESAAAAPEKAGGDGEASADGGKKEAKKEEKAAKKDDGSAAATTKSRNVADMFPYPVHQPQPAYVMSYNMAQPTASHAYYAPPMPMATQGYAYYPVYASPPPEFYYTSAPVDSPWASSLQPTHTYDTLFSEENPNGCVVM